MSAFLMPYGFLLIVSPRPAKGARDPDLNKHTNGQKNKSD